MNDIVQLSDRRECEMARFKTFHKCGIEHFSDSIDCPLALTANCVAAPLFWALANSSSQVSARNETILYAFWSDTLNSPDRFREERLAGSLTLREVDVVDPDSLSFACNVRKQE
jgi:hypothetical protein